MNILWTLEMIDLLDTMKPYDKKRWQNRAKDESQSLETLSLIVKPGVLEFSKSRCKNKRRRDLDTRSNLIRECRWAICAENASVPTLLRRRCFQHHVYRFRRHKYIVYTHVCINDDVILFFLFFFSLLFLVVFSRFKEEDVSLTAR